MLSVVMLSIVMMCVVLMSAVMVSVVIMSVARMRATHEHYNYVLLIKLIKMVNKYNR